MQRKTMKIAIFTCMLFLMIAMMIVSSSAATKVDDRYEKFYTEMKAGIITGSSEIKVETVKLYAKEIDKFFEAFVADNPDYSFCLGENITYESYPSTGLVSKIKITYDNANTVTSRKQLIDAVVNSIADQIDPEWPDAYKAIWINNYICDEYSYSDNTEYSDLYDFIVYRKGTCEAYTGMFTLVARKAGLESSFCHSTELVHAWNMVKIEDDWYHVDVTWNDNYSSRYEYMLISDAANLKARSDLGEFTTFSLYKATNTKYDDAFWRDGLYSAIANTSYGFYCIEKDALYRVDFDDVTATETSTIGEYLWHVPGSPSKFYKDTYHDVIGVKNLLFYSTPNVVYSLNLTDGTKNVICSSSNYYEIYGLRQDGNDLIIVRYDQENNQEMYQTISDALEYKKTYCTVAFFVDKKNFMQMVVENGTIIPYPSIDPVKESTDYYDYEFLGWKDFEEGTIANGNIMVFEAEFNAILRSYVLKFLNNESKVLEELTVDAGTKFSELELPAGMNMESETEYFLFTEWTGVSEDEVILADASVTAQYQAIPKMTIANEYSANVIAFYDAIDAALLSNNSTVDVLNLGISSADLDILIEMYRRNRPVFSFMLEALSNYNVADNIDLVTDIELSIIETENAENKMTWINNKIDLIVAEIDVDWSDLQKILWVNDYICDNFRYAEDSNGVGLYTFLADSCGGFNEYTDLFTALMQKLSIPVSHASTTIKKAVRVWNKVQVNDAWYNIDIANNDTFTSRYKYFLLSDAAIGELYGSSKTPAEISGTYSASSVTYDMAFWRDGLYCSIVAVGDDGYTIIGDKIYKVDLIELNTSPVKALASYIWTDEASGKAQNESFYDLIAIGDLLIYSTPTKVYAYSLSTNIHEVLYTSPKSTHIFSIHLEDNLLATVHCTDMSSDAFLLNTVLMDNVVKVTYRLDDGTVYATQTYCAGNKLEYPAAPSKDGFTFVGWSVNEGSVVESNLDVVAAFEPTRDFCTVIFVANDTMFEKIVVEEGTIIKIPTKKPEKESDTYNDYLFVSWDGYTEGMTATGSNIVLIAKFKQVTRKYNVDFYDGTQLISSVSYDAGTSFKDVAKPTMDNKIIEGVTYTFEGWDSTPSEILDNVVINAIFKAQPKTYTVRYFNGDEIVHTTVVEDGTILTFIAGAGVTKPSTEIYKYYFDKWVGAEEGIEIHSDIDLQATFIEVEIAPETNLVETETDPPLKDPDDNNAAVYLVVALSILIVGLVVVVVVSKLKKK